MGSWGLAQAKAHFSDVVELARQGEAQEITRNGKLVGFVVSPEEWEEDTASFSTKRKDHGGLLSPVSVARLWH